MPYYGIFSRIMIDTPNAILTFCQVNSPNSPTFSPLQNDLSEQVLAAFQLSQPYMKLYLTPI